MSTMDTETSRDYARLISKIDTEGYAFWTPYPGGVIGDCGIVRPDGQFVKLFNVFAQGTGFECLPTAEQQPTHVPTAADLQIETPTSADESERRVRNEDNIDVWRAQESSDWSVEVEAPIPAGQLGFGFALSASKGLAAFLAPCGPKRRIESYLMDRVFPAYLRRNCKAIRAHYSNRYDMGTVYILEGTTHATSWCRGFTKQRGRAIQGFVSVDPVPGIPAVRVGCGNGQMVNHPWIIAAGPSGQLPDGRLHLIRACLTVRHSKRPKWIRELSRQQVFTSENASSRITSGGPSISAGESIEESSTSFGEPAQSTSSMQGVQRAVDHLALSLESLTTTPPSNNADWTSSSDSDNSSDESTFYAPNHVQILLDTALEVYPEYDSLIVNWRVLQAFWDLYGRNSGYDRKLLVLRLEGFSDGEGGSAVVHEIALRTSEQSRAPLTPVPPDTSSRYLPPQPEQLRREQLLPASMPIPQSGNPQSRSESSEPLRPWERLSAASRPIPQSGKLRSFSNPKAEPSALPTRLAPSTPGIRLPFYPFGLSSATRALTPADDPRSASRPAVQSSAPPAPATPRRVRQLFEKSIGPLLFNGWVDSLVDQVMIGISYIPPPSFLGSTSTPIPVSALPTTYPLVYPPNRHGSHPIGCPSFSVTLIRTSAFPVRGQVTGLMRAIALGQMCFSIDYHVYVGGSNSGEMEFKGLIEVARL